MNESLSSFSQKLSISSVVIDIETISCAIVELSKGTTMKSGGGGGLELGLIDWDVSIWW